MSFFKAVKIIPGLLGHATRAMSQIRPWAHQCCATLTLTAAKRLLRSPLASARCFDAHHEPVSLIEQKQQQLHGSILLPLQLQEKVVSEKTEPYHGHWQDQLCNSQEPAQNKKKYRVSCSKMKSFKSTVAGC